MSDRSRWFVSTDWLAARLADPDVVVVDGSWHLPTLGRDGRKEYDAAHIPGAVFFDIDGEVPAKEEIEERLNALVARDFPVTSEWIADEELIANPGLVKTMKVKPPMGTGRVRLVRIGDIDLQPCGGTHVRSTAEIGRLAIGKMESKGKQNRRVRIRFGG